MRPALRQWDIVWWQWSQPRHCARAPRNCIRHRKSNGWTTVCRIWPRSWRWVLAFDVVMLTAVWMHLDPAQRQRAMPRVAALLQPRGVLIMSLRYGPVPPGRTMFAVSAEETIQLAAAEGLKSTLKFESADGVLRRPGVSWARLAFRKDPER